MESRPNILVIMSDQHSKHVLGCYGNDQVRTPNLNRLAAEGMRFDNAYCPSPVCCSSRMSFLTGRTPSRNRVWNNKQVMDPGVPTWAHVLGRTGYRTSLVGRMHFEGHDQYHGFEERPIGDIFAVHPGGSAREGYPSGQRRYVMETSGRGTTSYQWLDDRIAEAVCQYLQDRARQPQDRPFAAVAGFVLPHCPFIAPPDLFDYYHDRVDVPEIEASQPAMIQWYRKSREIDVPLDERRVRIARAAYFGLCDLFDQYVGRILDCLDETGLADDTLVVYCSDHGEMAGEHGCWTKNTYYEGSVGVPLIFRLPGLVPAGTSSDLVCNLMDIGPTLAELADASELPDGDGRSLLPALTGGPAKDWVNETYSEIVDDLMDPRVPSRMIRSGRWKLWADQEQPGQPCHVALFDLEQDPGELHDLGETPEYAAVRVDLLTRALDGWDPDAVRQAAVSRTLDYLAIAGWGRTAGGQLPELLPSPPPELEDDVEIL